MSHDVWEKIIEAAFTETGGPQSPLGTTLKNEQGAPIGVVVVWDPNPYPFVEAYLNIKASEARSVDGQAWDLRAVVVPCDAEREGQVKQFFLNASTRAW